MLARIRSRAWPPGELIPHEAELAAQYGCARSTVNRALREVAATGLIDRRRKAGTRVALNPLAPGDPATFPSSARRSRRAARVTIMPLISRNHVVAPLAVRSRMGLPPAGEAPACARPASGRRQPARLRGSLGQSASRPGDPRCRFSRSQLSISPISANAWLVQNVPYTRGELTLGAASADADCAACLRCAPGAAIFTMERITWIGDAPVTLVTQSHPPGYAITTAI